MTEPTDNELQALWSDAALPDTVTKRLAFSFVRAVLAKRSTPAPVRAEPYAQHAIWHGRDGDIGWDQYHDSSDPMPIGWDGDAPDEVIDLYTAAQVLAMGQVPPEEQILELAGVAPNRRVCASTCMTRKIDKNSCECYPDMRSGEPLTNPEFVDCVKAAGLPWDCRMWELKRQIEEVQNIKGGQHGTE